MKHYYKEIVICLLLAAAVLVIYAQVRHFDDLVMWDDCVTLRYVEARLEPVLDIRGVFRASSSPYHVPLITLSHMLDCWMFGRDYGLHHLFNVWFHIFNAILLFYVFRLTTGCLWRSACLAGLFAVHPLNVEPVAWLVMRTNVLSAFFFILTLFLYLRYAAKRTLVKYLLVVLCFMLGLLAKPEIAYLPFVLLLMDFWPLGRFKNNALPLPADGWGLKDIKFSYSKSSAGMLVMEKVPLLLVVFANIILQLMYYLYFVYYQSGKSMLEMPGKSFFAAVGLVNPPLFTVGLINLPLSYFTYLSKIVLPSSLPFFRFGFFQSTVDIYAASGAWSLLLVLTAIAIAVRHRYPHVFVGWCWFVITMSLTIFLDLFMHNSYAGVEREPLEVVFFLGGRYAYLPKIGIFILLVWGGAALGEKIRYHRPAFAVAFLGILFTILTGLSWQQVGYWKSVPSLFGRLIDLGQYPPEKVYHAVGRTMLNEDKPDQAVEYYRKAMSLAPDNAQIYQDLGVANTRQGDARQALISYRKALELNPELVSAHNNLANLLVDMGQVDEAIAHYKKALAVDPRQPEAYNNLASALTQKGEIEEAVAYLKIALTINPDYQTARDNLERLLSQERRTR